MSSVTHWMVSIDQHDFWVITTDFVPVHPVKISKLQVSIGQRYGIIVEGTPLHPYPGDNYWIRIRKARGCGKVKFVLEEAAIIRYDRLSHKIPVSHHTGWPKTFKAPYCNDMNHKHFHPIVPWHVPNPFYKPKSDALMPFNAFEGNERGMATLRASCGYGGQPGRFTRNYIRWSLGDRPFWKDHGGYPTNWFFNNPNFKLLEETFVASSPGYGGTEWQFFVIAANYSDHRHTSIPTSHPIHLHGHDFVILGQSHENYIGLQSLRRFTTLGTFNNPPRRDTALLPNGGFLLMAFKNDNPGAWVIHCHIAFHASAGLAIQIVENPCHNSTKAGQSYADVMDNPMQHKRTCDSWHKWLRHNPHYEQSDNGL
ncbi:hypothetical protein BJ508DRAFT_418233 [Ascobolus immersus RN42]|uniref:Cupredoxin n=1 Tax=Ascobolus immersus RN42 TaxID=1160509 RepID=A0A3N4HPM1_ASCIM|nr:hypothetical protein BJ508DRAFT_418233 [Ascobolus immersus RN42]